MILLEKRFHIGDVISVPGHTEGTVKHIGFRSTLIKKFDSTPITIPNYIFAEAPILNYTNRSNRRINWIIGLEYNSTLDQIKNFSGIDNLPNNIFKINKKLNSEFFNEKILINEIDYYFTNSIARASKTMSDCRNVKFKSLKEGTNN